MENLNELLMWWALWVDSNVDILIMTITLIVVAGLVLEVVRLNRKLLLTEDNLSYLCNRSTVVNEDQRQVNVHLAEDIAKLQKQIDNNKKFADKVYAGLVSVNNWQDSVAVRFTDLEKKVDLLGKVVGELKFKRKAIKK